MPRASCRTALQGFELHDDARVTPIEHVASGHPRNAWGAVHQQLRNHLLSGVWHALGQGWRNDVQMPSACDRPPASAVAMKSRRCRMPMPPLSRRVATATAGGKPGPLQVPRWKAISAQSDRRKPALTNRCSISHWIAPDPTAPRNWGRTDSRAARGSGASPRTSRSAKSGDARRRARLTTHTCVRTKKKAQVLD